MLTVRRRVVMDYYGDRMDVEVYDPQPMGPTMALTGWLSPVSVDTAVALRYGYVYTNTNAAAILAALADGKGALELAGVFVPGLILAKVASEHIVRAFLPLVVEREARQL